MIPSQGRPGAASGAIQAYFWIIFGSFLGHFWVIFGSFLGKHFPHGEIHQASELTSLSVRAKFMSDGLWQPTSASCSSGKKPIMRLLPHIVFATPPLTMDRLSVSRQSGRLIEKKRNNRAWSGLS
ncbi:MAG TPA: hypothetical protein VK979_10655 [Guyparkeria sp.]|nr:hypothetical protein [Guyparkeria sp.]